MTSGSAGDEKQISIRGKGQFSIGCGLRQEVRWFCDLRFILEYFTAGCFVFYSRML